jgi:hypothetical protein
MAICKQPLAFDVVFMLSCLLILIIISVLLSMYPELKIKNCKKKSSTYVFYFYGQIHIDLQTRNFQQHIKIFLQLSLLYITRPDYCFDQRNNFDLFWCNHLCSEDMFKCNDLFWGQLPVTKEQLEPALIDAPTSLLTVQSLSRLSNYASIVVQLRRSRHPQNRTLV